MGETLKPTFKERLKYFFGHMLFSCVLLAIALFMIYQVWYPSPLVKAMGVMKIYALMLFIDVTLGPLLTAIVYKKNKRLFLFNLAVIVALQLSAFFYGLYIVSQGRPAFQVFVVDDIELVDPLSVNKDKLPNEIGYSLFSKPIWIASTYSDNTNVAKQQRQDEIIRGISLTTKAENYQLLSRQKSKIMQKMQSLNNLEKFNTKVAIKNQILPYPQAVGWLPVKGGDIDMTALFDKDGNPVAIVDLRPWE